jgi:hypothetical protein
MDGDHGLNLAHDHAAVLGLRRGLRVAYSGAAAATYADNYWQSYNPDWPSFTRKGGDCTNFVSQVLYAGASRWGLVHAAEQRSSAVVAMSRPEPVGTSSRPQTKGGA